MNLAIQARSWLSAAQLHLCLRLPTLAAVHLSRLLRRKRRSKAIEAILVIRMDGLGDCVLTLPLLHNLRLCFPSATVTVVTRTLTAEVFRICPHVDEVLSFDPSPSRRYPDLLQTLYTTTKFFLRYLRGRYFDLSLSPRWDIDVSLSTFLCAMTRAPMTVGYEDATSPVKSKENKGFQRAFTVVLPAGPVEHEVLRNTALARAVGCSQATSGPVMEVPASLRAEATSWLPPRSHGLRIALGLPAGSAKRRWPVERYLAVLEELSTQGVTLPIAFVDGDTRQMGSEILKHFPDGRIAASFTLSQVAATLSECDVFLGSDSGLGQIAAAVGCATVTISPHPLDGDIAHTNSPIRFRPYGPRSAVIQPTEGRACCEEGCEMDEPHCILDVDPHQVALAVLRFCESPAEPMLRWAEGKNNVSHVAR